jgi:ribosomal protein L32
MIQTTNGGGREHEVASAWVVAFYAPDTGAIVHMHSVVSFAGGRELSEEEAVEEARRHARRIGHVVEGLRTKVSSNLGHSSRAHRIDLQTGEFVRLPRPELGKRQSPT